MYLVNTYLLALALVTPAISRVAVVEQSPTRTSINATASKNTKSVGFRYNGRFRFDSSKPFQVSVPANTSSVQVTPYSKIRGQGTRGRSKLIRLIYASSTIPSLSRWEENMVQAGREICNEATIRELSTWEGNAWYYDGIKVFYQIADYTHDNSWKSCVDYVKAVYRKYVLDNNGVIPGWRVFPHGLYEDFKRTGDQRSKNAALLLAKRSAFAASGGGASFELSRETAYIIHAYLIAEKLGAGRNVNLSRAVNYAIGHINQWTSSASYVRPFMIGLTMEALIHYHQATGDSRAQNAVKKAADWLWSHLWSESNQSFPYNWCRSRTRCPDSEDDGDGPDLSLLIFPAYAWLYTRTKDAAYANQADQIFDGGVRRAYLGNGKHFNQNYRWSFSGIWWRKKG